jgi:hypothetical protein
MNGGDEPMKKADSKRKRRIGTFQGIFDSLKERNGKSHAAGRNGNLLAKKQLSAIKKWAGTTLKTGFSGREHDAVVYEKGSA